MGGMACVEDPVSMDSDPNVLEGISAHGWVRAIYGVFGIALLMIFIGAVSIGVHAFAGNSGAGDVADTVGKACAWGIFFSLVAEVPLIIVMTTRVRRERKNGYATIRTESGVPPLKKH
jgi:hypothetical protein